MTQYNIFYNYVAAAMLPDGESAEMPPTEEIPMPAVSAAGSEGRFVDFAHIEEQSRLFADYQEQDNATLATCWYDLGPVKSLDQQVFMDLTCFLPETVDGLREFAASTPELQGNHRRYYNLPMPGADREIYWPNYKDLQRIKSIWDPENLFNSNDGIVYAGATTV